MNAYQKGFLAALEGISFDSNPYRGYDDKRSWECGWLDAIFERDYDN